MERILVLIAGDAYVHMDEALRSARDNAAHRQRLSYGVSLAQEPGDDDTAAMRELGSVQFVTPAINSWQDMPALWRGEGYVLIAHAGMRFTKHWDTALLHAINHCKTEQPMTAVLTGFLPTQADPVDAVSAVAAESFDEKGRLCFRKGATLRYAKEPVPAAFLHPAFCFGPAAFFRDMAQEEPPFFLAAYRREWHVFTLHKPLIRSAWEVPVLPVALPDSESALDAIRSFGMRFAMRLEQRQLSAMARSGLFHADLSYPMHVPLSTRLKEGMRDMLLRKSSISPLCVTAYLTLDVPGESLPEESLSRFARLAALKNLSLMCFVGGDMGRRVLPVMPNVMDYKRRYGLPLQVDVTPANALNFVKLSKMFLLLQGREKYLNHTHYVWMNFGYLRYPVYERTAFDWSALCTDRIVLATISQQADTSMIVVPEGMLKMLCQEITRICSDHLARTHALPQEQQLWQQLLREKSNWFSPIELSTTHALFDLTMDMSMEENHAES